jgi:hypothetical protein
MSRDHNRPVEFQGRESKLVSPMSMNEVNAAIRHDPKKLTPL